MAGMLRLLRSSASLHSGCAQHDIVLGALAISLDGECHAAPDRPGGVDEVDGLTIAPDDRNVSLSQQVADVDQGFHAAAEARHRLADEDIQVRIRLTG